MTEESVELGIFELPVVLLPGERTALHIFEDRYKRMIGDCLESGGPFGIVFKDDDGARRIGCAAQVEELVERFDDGRMNIIVAGQQPIRVLDRFDSPEYPSGSVETIDSTEEEPSDDPDAAADARETFAALAERATGERPDPDGLAASDAYEIAARIELPAETKQELLEMRSESERIRLLARALRAVSEALERSELIAERASGNGHITFSSDGPDPG
jgi:Lon protease-like protein